MKEDKSVFLAEEQCLQDAKAVLGSENPQVPELLDTLETVLNRYEQMLKLTKRVTRHSDHHVLKLKETNTALEEIALKDHLTEIANRRGFLLAADGELARASRYNRPVSLIMFDVDFFKKVNDQYGHDVGDLVLKDVARIGREVLRDDDIFGRIGGEEFAVVLPETDADAACQTAERLRAQFEEAVLSVDTQTISFTASFGVCASHNDDGNDIEFLLKQADIALYQAKSGGRNQVRISGA